MVNANPTLQIHKPIKNLREEYHIFRVITVDRTTPFANTIYIGPTVDC